MHSSMRALLPLILISAIVPISGCISDPTAFAKGIPMVQEFLEEHPNAQISIVHYSRAEAGQVLDQVREDCGKLSVEAKEYYFVNISDPSTNLFVRAWVDWESRIVECVYKEGVIIDPGNCTSLYSSGCFGDHVYWFDSCGNRESKKEYCPLGCASGECMEGDVCDPEKTYTEKPRCVCPEGYEMIVLYPRCTDSDTGAITAMPFAVTEAVAERAVTVVTGEVDISPDFTTEFGERCPGSGPVYRCVKREECRSHARIDCYKGHVFWFDSCGHVQEKKEYCEYGCESGECITRERCEDAGGYCIYKYCTKDAKVCPDGTTVGRVPPYCNFEPCPGETTDADATGMIHTGVAEQPAVTTDASATTTTYACREGYAYNSDYWCPDDGMCCAPERQEACGPDRSGYCIDFTDECRAGYRGIGPDTCSRGRSAECCVPAEDEFCGWSTYHACSSDPDCAPGGCSGQVCEGAGEGTSTTCEYMDCYDAGNYGLSCGCHEGQCQWVGWDEKCWESDGGYDIHNYGCCEAGDSRLCDRCSDNGTLTERYCEGISIAARTVSCPDGHACEDGACISVGCRDENYDCYVGNIPCCEGLVEVPMANEDESGQCIAATCGSICRPCGNGICDENENWCVCPEDCETPCAEEGNPFSKVYTDQYPENCCEGLTEWNSGMDTRMSIGDGCYETGMVAGSPVGTCIECGNAVCEETEDVCNCPQDCNASSSQFTSIDGFCSEYVGADTGLTEICEEGLMDLAICDICDWNLTAQTS